MIGGLTGGGGGALGGLAGGAGGLLSGIGGSIAGGFCTQFKVFINPFHFNATATTLHVVQEFYTNLVFQLSVQSVVNGFISLNNITAAICLNAIDTLEKGDYDI